MIRKSVICFTLCFTLCLAERPFVVLPAMATDSDIDSVFINETVSYDGHEFFRIFTETFEASDYKVFSTLVVKEFPDIKTGNRIQIEYEYTILYETTIYRGSKYVGRNASQAVNMVKYKMKAWKKNEGKIDPDLALNEL
jgi:hypothetical protein